MAPDWSVTPGVTLLGKTPARADFVRINHGSASAIALDEWLQRGLEELVLGGQRSAPAANFLFVPRDADEALAGLLAPSRDKAGRAFPIALFGALPAGIAQQQPYAVPLGCAGLLAESRALFAALAEIDYEELKQRVARIEAPGPSAYERATAEADELLAQAAPAAWLERVFGPGGDEVAAHALQTLTSTAAENGGKSAVLECPVHEPVDAIFWLALASRGARAPVSFFWTEPSDSGAPAQTRLLLCLTPPPTAILLHLAAPKPKPGKLQLLAAPGSAAAAGAARDEFDRLLACPNLRDFIAGA